MWWFLSSLVLSALAAPPAFIPTDAEAEVIAAWSARHVTASCDTQLARLHDPEASLGRIVQHVTAPPWVATRAAGCAADAGDAYTDLIVSWVQQDNLRGITELVLRRLDSASGSLRTTRQIRRIAVAAMHGPHAERARQVLGESRTPSIRSLLESP